MKLASIKYFITLRCRVCFLGVCISGFLCMFSGAAWAQVYVLDALRFSSLGQSGSARTLGIGGAQAALGADISSASLNPAGLGFYRQSEFVFSPTLHLASSTSGFLGSSSSDNASNFNIGTLGFALSRQTEDFVPSIFRGGTFAISLARLQNFNSNVSYSGLSPSQRTNNGYKAHSIVDYYMGMANKNGTFPEDVLFQDLPTLDPDQALLETAFQTFIIDTLNGNGGSRFANFLPMSASDLKQKGRIETTGSIQQWDIAYGANLSDKIYLGASLGILPLNYREVNEYSEQIDQVNISTNDPDYTYYQTFTGVRISQQDIREVKGSGVNLKVGIIVRPIDALRIGAYIHTPTRFALSETVSQSLTSEFNGLEYWKPTGEILTTKTEKTYAGQDRLFDYKLITPMRFGGGLAYFVGKSGFITADAEYVSYNRTRLKASGINFSDDENQIRNVYKSVINFRTGVELRKNRFRFRLGGALAGQPYAKPDLQPSRAVQTFTGGLGVRGHSMYADFAFAHNRTNASYSPHPYAEFAQIKNRFNTISLTVGSLF